MAQKLPKLFKMGQRLNKPSKNYQRLKILPKLQKFVKNGHTVFNSQSRRFQVRSNRHWEKTKKEGQKEKRKRPKSKKKKIKRPKSKREKDKKAQKKEETERKDPKAKRKI